MTVDGCKRCSEIGELCQYLVGSLKRRNRLMELNAPEVILDVEDAIIDDRANDLFTRLSECLRDDGSLSMSAQMMED